MARINIQVASIEAFTCQQFKQLFSEGNRNGAITTSNGRKYNVAWDTSSNTISVKRDLTNVDRWTRLSETIDRWFDGDFSSNAEKWENRLTVQKENVNLAEPLGTRLKQVLRQLETTKTSIESGQFSSSTTIQDRLNEISTPLTQLLEEKRQHLCEQGSALAAAINEDLESSEVWTQQKTAKNAIEILEVQAKQLTSFIRYIQTVTDSYVDTMYSIDASKYSLICAAVLSRMNSVAVKMQQIVDGYFNPDVKGPRREIIKMFNELIDNEMKIILELNGSGFSADFSNSLLPPSYEETGTQQQLRIKLDYHAQHIIFMSNLVDLTKTWNDIEEANEALKDIAYQ